MRRIAQQNRTLSSARPWRPRLRGDRGGTLVETAFSIAILLTLVVGIMEASLAVYSYHFISNAAREGVRYAIVRGDTWQQPPWSVAGVGCSPYTAAGCVATSENVEAYVKSLAFPGIDVSNLEVAPKWYSIPGGSADDANNAAGDFVQVTVTYNFPFSVPFIPRKTLSMSSTSIMAISQ